MSSSDLQPRRDLTLTHATSLVVGITIGTGIFLKSAAMAQAVGTPALVLAAWVVAGVVAMLGALCFAELGALLPHAGGNTSTCGPPTARSRASCSRATPSCSAGRPLRHTAPPWRSSSPTFTPWVMSGLP